MGLEPAQRCERQRPGELIHIDVKKLGRIRGGAGKRVRDGPRQHEAHTEVLGDEQATTAIASLHRAVKFFASYGITAIYASSAEGTAALDGWLFHYNHRRRHSAIGRQPPATRRNNLLGSCT